MIREHLRPALGVAFMFIVPAIPGDSIAAALIFAAAVIAYMAARVVVLVEPEARRYILDHPVPRWMHIGEACFVSFALILAMVMVSERGILDIGMVAGTLVAIGYLVAHGVGFTLAEALLSPTQAPAKPGLRRFAMVAAFVAEESVLLANMLSVEGARASMGDQPWGWTDTLTLPLFAIFVLVMCYLPITRISRAADDPERGPLDAIVIHVAALYVFALTGGFPLL